MSNEKAIDFPIAFQMSQTILYILHNNYLSIIFLSFINEFVSNTSIDYYHLFL